MKHIVEAIEDIKNGKMVILVDNEDRENEGDLVLAAEFANAENVNFMIKEARGLVCLAMTSEGIERLQLPMMSKNNTSKLQTAFTVSIEAREGVESGISAHDRARTIQVATDERSGPADVVVPGHIFPLRARDGGVLVRNGHTEGSVDLARLAGCKPSAVICEIMNDDGTMARRDDLEVFAKKHDLKMISIKDLITYRFMNEAVVEEVSSAHMPTEHRGDFTIKVFQNIYDGSEHVALIKAPYDCDKEVLVRIHSECLTGDVLGSIRCDCGKQRDVALECIAKEGGVFLYMRQEGRGIGLTNKIKAYGLQEQGMDTVEANHHLGLPADARDYGVSVQMLKHLNIEKVKLMTNNPRKLDALSQYGFKSISREPLIVGRSKHNEDYLTTKKNKLGHML